MARERRVSGRRVDDFPPRRRTSWDFSRVADGQVYLLRKGRDFDVEVDSLAIAARRWAREHGYSLTTAASSTSGKRAGPKRGCTCGSRGGVPAGGPSIRRMPLT
jgi:hypothetical protein